MEWAINKVHVLYSIQFDHSTPSSPALKPSHIIKVGFFVSSSHLILHAELRSTRPAGCRTFEWLVHVIASLHAPKVTYKQYQMKMEVLHTRRHLLQMQTGMRKH